MFSFRTNRYVVAGIMKHFSKLLFIRARRELVDVEILAGRGLYTYVCGSSLLGFPIRTLVKIPNNVSKVSSQSFGNQIFHMVEIARGGKFSSFT